MLFLALVAVAGVALAVPAARDRKGKEEFVVVIDAGHGGKDVGAAENGVREKDINLAVARQLASLIRKKMKDTKVVMTRDNDTFVSLQGRADIANKAGGDLFISIHTNSVDKKNKNRTRVEGSSVYALGLHKDANNMAVAQRENSVIELENGFEEKYSGFDPSDDTSYIIFEMAQKKNLSNSLKFAGEAQKQLVAAGRTNRGVHQAGFWVLWATSMPAVLVELDFICNPVSAKYMSSEKGVKHLAEALLKAVENYEKGWRKQTDSKSGSRKGDGGDSRTVKVTTTTTTETVISGSEDEGLAQVSRKKKKKRTDEAPVIADKRSRGAYAAARKRRSDASRAISDSRNVETTEIPISSGIRKSVVEETFEASAAVESSGKGSDRSVKRGSDKKDDRRHKKDKKNRRDNNKGDGPSHKAKREKFMTVYKIQVLASADELSGSNPRFQGLSPISRFKEGNMFKYTYGESQNKSEIETLLKEVRKKIPDAFIIKSVKSRRDAD